MAKHNKLGKDGELIAFMVLQRDGFTILETNWKFRKAEIDIIATKDKILISVEVKTRSTNDFGSPQDFVNKKKIKLMVSAMNEYILNKDLDTELRFDIIAITKDKSSFDIQHFKDAFLYF